MNAFFEPLQYGFMRDALLVGAVVAAMCAVLSCFLILKGWSLMGDAISHAVLPGIVIAYIVGIPLAIGPSPRDCSARQPPASSNRTAGSRRIR